MLRRFGHATVVFVRLVRQAGLRRALKEIPIWLVEVGDGARRTQIESERLELAAQFQESQARVHRLESELARAEVSIGWLARQHQLGRGRGRRTNITPVVTVIIPTYDRGARLPDALRSVQAQTFGDWEVIVVDDGSTDDTTAVLRLFEADDRIRSLHQDHTGQAAARNRGLEVARGSIITYLDSDDIWYPTYLQVVVDAYAADPSVETTQAAQLIVDPADGRAHVCALTFDRSVLSEQNLIPITAFSHRSSLCEALGGFDESLSRYCDWDLILNYTATRSPAVIDVICGEYRVGEWPRVSNTVSDAVAQRQIRRKHRPPRGRGCRVLYVSGYSPQISETYVLAEMTQAVDEGFEVAIWSEFPPPCRADTDIPTLTGSIADAVAAHRPDVAHVHHLGSAHRYLPEIDAAGVPMTVRAHGFEFDQQSAHLLVQHPAVRSVYMFPHLVDRVGGAAGRLVPMAVGFDADRYQPDGPKDRRLVVRAALGSPTKDLLRFIRVGARCPEHRFVLIAAGSVTYPNHIDDLRAENKALGGHVEILENEQPDAIVPIMKRAGIYFHTHALTEPYGMPVSIAEAMGTGAYVVARRCDAAVGYIGEAGDLYDTDDEAVGLIRATSSWSDAQWRATHLAAVERAHRHYSSDAVFGVLFEDWARIAAD